MSWSIGFIGTPEKIAEAIDKHSEQLHDYSKEEFDDAKEHLKALVKQNFGSPGSIYKLTASGHGTKIDCKPAHRTLSCQIEGVYGILV